MMYTKNIRVTVNPAFDLNKLEELIASTDKRLKDIDSLVFDGWWFDGKLVPYPKWYNSWQKSSVNYKICEIILILLTMN